MEQLKVDYNELEILDDEYDEDIMKYKGELFTGMSYEDTQRVHIESYYDQGRLVSEKSWNKKGILIYDYCKNKYSKEYYEDGTLKQIRDQSGYKKYYSSGKIKTLYEVKEKYAMVYWKDGAWILRHKSGKIDARIMSKEYIIFHDEIWKEKYLEILTDDIDYFYPYFRCWIDDCEMIHKSYIICRMIACDNLWIKEAGIQLAEKYRIMESMDLLEQERDNQAVPPPRANMMYTRTISLCARQAIGTLKFGG